MLWNAQNLTVRIPAGEMPCAAFGSGSRTMVILPGLGDGLKSVRGMALPLAALYRAFVKDFRVLVLSRVIPQAENTTTRDMAAQVAQALENLQVKKASVVGVSMGGMIAQHLAADFPELVDKLVLTATCPCPNPILTEAVEGWMDMARRGDHRSLMVDNGRRIYSDGYLKKNGWMFPVTALFTKPKSYEQFLVLTEACRIHDARERLASITAPTLVIGGEQDKCLGGDASRELAAAIGGARLKMYPQYGHGCYEEAADFRQTVLDFLRK